MAGPARVAGPALAAGLALCGAAVQAAECRLALAMAMDVSSSVDAAADALQRRGLAAALIAPEVEAAFFASPLPVALAAYEWSGRHDQVVLLDWTLIGTREDLLAAARRIGRSERSHTEYPTAMGYALGYGAGLLARGPDCLHRTLDMAGDGVNNEGFPPAAAYAEFPFAGVTVNGLVVRDQGGGDAQETVEFYRDEVVHGPGAFLEIAAGFEDYERAMRRKLEREVMPRAVGSAETQAGGPG